MRPDVPEGGRFDSESALLERINEIHASGFGPLVVGDAEVAVFEAQGDDSSQDPKVIGKADAARVRQHGGVPEEAIWG